MLVVFHGPLQTLKGAHAINYLLILLVGCVFGLRNDFA